jgi:hypothetical protein
MRNTPAQPCVTLARDGPAVNHEGGGDLARRRAGGPSRGEPPAEKGEIARGLRERVWPLLPARSPVFPLVDSVHPLADAAKVHEYFDGGSHVGKIALVP